MITEFDLHGLRRENGDIMATVSETFNGKRIAQDWFRCKIDMLKERKEALWDYCKGNWKDKKVAVVEHEGFVNGYPKNPIVKEIRENES